MAATLGMMAALSGLSGVLPSPLRSLSLSGLLNPAGLFGPFAGAFGSPVPTRSPGGRDGTVFIRSLAQSGGVDGMAPIGAAPTGAVGPGGRPDRVRTGVGRHPTRWEFRFARSGFKGTFRQWRRQTERRLARRRAQQAHAHRDRIRHGHRHDGHHPHGGGDRRHGGGPGHRGHGGHGSHGGGGHGSHGGGGHRSANHHHRPHHRG